MRTRKDLLLDLLACRGSVIKNQKKLSVFGYDTEEPVVIAKSHDIESVLSKCIDGFLSVSDIEEWANAIEFRDDIDFENEQLKEFVFELANPEINGAINVERLLEIVENLQKVGVIK